MAKPSAIAPPSSVTASLTGLADITVAWTASSGAKSYRVYRNGLRIASPTALRWVDTNLPAGSYGYQVSAVDKHGVESAKSPMTALVLVAAPPPTTAATLTLQNTSGSPIAAHEVTTGLAALSGQIPYGSQLQATINSSTVATQLDVKKAWPDGSAKFGVITFMQPAIPASTSYVATFAAVAPSGSAISLSGLVAAGYDVTVQIVVSGGSTYNMNVGTLLNTALGAAAVTYWQQGPQCTEGRFDHFVVGSLHISFDVAWFADGTHRTLIQFRNDYAMSTAGGEGDVTYAVTIALNGSTWFTKASVVHFQYTNWTREVWSAGAPTVNIIPDFATLLATKLVLNYDTSLAVPSAMTTFMQNGLVNANWQVPMTPINLAVNRDVNFLYGPIMGDTGGRPDLGPITGYQACWMQSGGADYALQFILGQADGGGAIPWHFHDPDTGTWLSLADYPTLDINGFSQTQSVASQAAWRASNSHQPATAYIPYLATGKRYYLDEVNALGTWGLFAMYSGSRSNGSGFMANGLAEERAQAWCLRDVDHACVANPDGSALETYFATYSDNSWGNFANTIIPLWNNSQGTTYGLLPGQDEVNRISPWQQNYLVSTVCFAVENGLGSTNAATVMAWVKNFCEQAVLAASPWTSFYATAYQYVYYQSNSGDLGVNPWGTWAGIKTATDTHNGGALTDYNADPTYMNLALMALSCIISANGSADATTARNLLLASGGAGAGTNDNPQFSIIPR